MAPPNGSAKPRKPGGVGNKPTKATKPVVPAIPLPFVKRRAAAAAAAAAAAVSTDVASTSPASATSSPPEIPRTETKPANGTAPAIDKDDRPAGSEVLEAVNLRSDKAAELPDVAVKPDGQLSPAVSASERTSTINELEDAVKTPAISDHSDQPTVEPKVNIHAPAPDSRPPVDTPVKPNGIATKDDIKQRIVDHPHANVSKARPPPAISPNRYQMPPPFQPANRPLGLTANGDMPRGSRPPVPNGPPRMHQPHLSNGSVHFGAFHGSTSSSPAPPLSGGIAPPPGMPIPDGRPPYMGHTANGFPPLMPYSADMAGATNFDPHTRPAMGYGPLDSYPPYSNNFGPSTPHSFHDSQASGQAEENAMYHQYPPGLPRNGVTTGPGEDLQTPNHQGRVFGGHDPRMMPNPGPPPHMLSRIDDADDFAAYLRQQWGAPDFGDCVLELRYTDDRAPPVRVPGHRFVFARSDALTRVLRKQSSQNSPTASDQMQQIILLETGNKWIRSEAFYIAVQRLYGLPLFQIPPPPNGIKQEDVTDTGSIADRFHFALSYAAAGQLLAWDSVARRGCEIAIQLLNWQTIDKALEFALEGYSDRGDHDLLKYAEGSRAILSEVVTYIINNLPPNFVVDASLPAPEHYARLPLHPTPPSSPGAEKPAIARGTAVQLGRNRRSQQITGIQFGDLSLSENKNGSASETPKASQQARPTSHAVLTRVLLNLPFNYLKMALESVGSNNVSGWANAEYRYRIIKEAVAERERRRLEAVSAVKAGIVSDWETIFRYLCSPEPRFFGEWSILGWQEEILPYGNPDGPSLGRKWVPLRDSRNGANAAYP